MRRSLLFALSLFAAILASCNHDDFSAGNSRVTLKAFHDVATRVTFDGEKSAWCDGDCLNVVIEGLDDIYTFNYDAATECDFGCDNLTMPAEQNDVYAFYGLSAENIDVEGKTASLALGAARQIQSTDAPAAHIAQYDVLYGKALGSGRSDISIAMKHSVAAIKIQLTNSLQETVKIKSVTFTAPEGVALAGNYTIDSVADEISLVDDATSSNSVIVEFEEAILLEAGDDCTAWIAAAPFALTEGDNLTIDITSADDAVYRCEKVMPAEGVAFNAGSVMTTEIALGNNAQLVGPDAPAEITIVVDPKIEGVIPSNFPTSAKIKEGTFTLAGYDFSFDSPVPFYLSSNKRIRFEKGITKTNVAMIKLPVIEGYKLTSVIMASLDINSSRNYMFAITDAQGSEISGGEAYKLTDVQHLYNLTLPTDDTECYIRISNSVANGNTNPADLAYISLTYSKI